MYCSRDRIGSKAGYPRSNTHAACADCHGFVPVPIAFGTPACGSGCPPSQVSVTRTAATHTHTSGSPAGFTEEVDGGCCALLRLAAPAPAATVQATRSHTEHNGAHYTGRHGVGTSVTDDARGHYGKAQRQGHHKRDAEEHKTLLSSITHIPSRHEHSRLATPA